MTHPAIDTKTLSSQEFIMFMDSLRSLAALEPHNDPDVFMFSLAQTMINFMPLKQKEIVCCPNHIREYIHEQSPDLDIVFECMLDATIGLFHMAKSICYRKQIRDD